MFFRFYTCLVAGTEIGIWPIFGPSTFHLPSGGCYLWTPRLTEAHRRGHVTKWCLIRVAAIFLSLDDIWNADYVIGLKISKYFSILPNFSSVLWLFMLFFSRVTFICMTLRPISGQWLRMIHRLWVDQCWYLITKCVLIRKRGQSTFLVARAFLLVCPKGGPCQPVKKCIVVSRTTFVKYQGLGSPKVVSKKSCRFLPSTIQEIFQFVNFKFQIFQFVNADFSLW